MSPPPQKSRPLRVFVVEDHPDTLNYLCLYLEGSGHEVQCASTLAESLEAIPKANCDVLICDVGLPDGDGWQLLAQLKKANHPHPAYAIVMSGFGTLSDRSKSAAAGYRHHILKPFNPRELGQMLQEAAAEAKSRED